MNKSHKEYQNIAHQRDSHIIKYYGSHMDNKEVVLRI